MGSGRFVAANIGKSVCGAWYRAFSPSYQEVCNLKEQKQTKEKNMLCYACLDFIRLSVNNCS